MLSYRSALLPMSLYKKDVVRSLYLLRARFTPLRKGFEHFLSWAYFPFWLRDTARRFEFNSSQAFVIHRLFTYFFRIFRIRMSSFFSRILRGRKPAFSYFFLRPSQMNAFLFAKFFIRRLVQHYLPPQIFFRFSNAMHERYKIPKRCLGFMIRASGRYDKRERASFFWFQKGKIKPSTVSAGVDYAFLSVPLKYGACGVKVYFSWSKPNLKRRYHIRRFSFFYPKVMKLTEGRPGPGGFVLNSRFFRRFRKRKFFVSSFFRRPFLKKMSNPFLRKFVLLRSFNDRILKDVGIFTRGHFIFENLFVSSYKTRFDSVAYIFLKRWSKIYFRLLRFLSSFLRRLKRYRSRAKLWPRLLQKFIALVFPPGTIGLAKTRWNNWARALRKRLFFHLHRYFFPILKKLWSKRRYYFFLYKRKVVHAQVSFYQRYARFYKKRKFRTKDDDYFYFWRKSLRVRSNIVKRLTFPRVMQSGKSFLFKFGRKAYFRENRFLYLLTTLRRYQYWVVDRIRLYREIERRRLLIP